MKNKEYKEYTKYLESKISELTSERDKLLYTFLHPKKKPFDVPQYSIELKLPDEIPSPFIQ